MFTPAYRARKALPEYLVLIDRASFHDQHSQLVDALLKELDDYGLFIERYYFDGDPRRCYAARTPSTACTLDSLQARYADYRLLIFADSPQFFDPLGHPAAWLEKLHAWASPVLFTPSAQWDYYTQALQDNGFLLLTTGQKGLAQLVAHLARNEIKRDKLADDDYPSLLAQRPLRFLERHAPNPNIVEQLLKQLRRYLDKDGFRWLAACAVYPELHWQLTLYLAPDSVGVPPVGANLFARFRQSPATDQNRANKFAPTKINEALLLKLTRLPWLRHHYLPNWLRLALLEALPAAQHRAVRQQLETLLQNLHPEAASKADLSLPLAQHTWRSFWKKDGKLQDHVFLDFMNGHLAVKAHFSSGKLLRHPAWLIGFAGVVAVVGYFTFAPVKPVPPLPIELPTKQPEPLKPPVTSEVPPVVPPSKSAVDTASTVPFTPIAPNIPATSSVITPPVSSNPPAVPQSSVPPQTPTLVRYIQSVKGIISEISEAEFNACSKKIYRKAGQEGLSNDNKKMLGIESLRGNSVNDLGVLLERLKQQDACSYGAPDEMLTPDQKVSTQKISFEMVTIPKGSFTMGCKDGRDKECENDEKPDHKVQVRAFQLGKTEVTQGQWQAVMGSNPSRFKDCGDNCPVENVSWDDIQTFIQKLNAQTGKTYRLPTEAEWEYAYRAGTNSSFYTGNCITTSQANYDGNYDFNNCGAKTGVYKQKTVAVGSYPANPWGLYDMAGNVWEWTQDNWHDSYNGAPDDGSVWNKGGDSAKRVLRGGSWDDIPLDVRAAVRSRIVASIRYGFVGFRLARTLP